MKSGERARGHGTALSVGIGHVSVSSLTNLFFEWLHLDLRPLPQSLAFVDGSLALAVGLGVVLVLNHVKHVRGVSDTC